MNIQKNLFFFSICMASATVYGMDIVPATPPQKSQESAQEELAAYTELKSDTNKQNKEQETKKKEKAEYIFVRGLLKHPILQLPQYPYQSE